MAGSLLGLPCELLALTVQPVQFSGQSFGLGAVFSRQELIGHVGVSQPSGSVEPRPQCVADGGGVHLPRLEAGLPAERLDARPLHLIDTRQSTMHQRAVLA